MVLLSQVARHTRELSGVVLAMATGAYDALRRPVSIGIYKPEIDGLRFFAIAIVVTGHILERAERFSPDLQIAMEAQPLLQNLKRPWIGVYLFFVLSSYILACQCRRVTYERFVSPGYLKTYFLRRLMRIQPGYAVLLASTFLFIMATGFVPDGTRQYYKEPQSIIASLLGSLFYVHDLVWGTFPRLFPPGWSLEVEVQFYLLAPLLFCILSTRIPRPIRIGLGVICTCIACVASLMVPEKIGIVHVDMSLIRFMQFFCFGILLAEVECDIRRWSATLAPLAAGIIGWLSLGLLLLLPEAGVPHGIDDLLRGGLLRLMALAAIAGLFVSIFAPPSSFRRTCSSMPIYLIGGASYAFYLTHLQVIHVTMSGFVALIDPTRLWGLAWLCLLQIIFVVIVGFVFFLLVEKPSLAISKAFWRVERH